MTSTALTPLPFPITDHAAKRMRERSIPLDAVVLLKDRGRARPAARDGECPVWYLPAALIHAEPSLAKWETLRASFDDRGYLVTVFWRGDASGGLPLTGDQRELAAAHMTLAMRYARALCRPCPWLGDEAESAAMLVVTQAAKAHVGDDAGFPSYLFERLRAAVSDLRRPDRGGFCAAQLWELESHALPDHGDAPDEREIVRELRTQVQSGLAMLSADLARVLRLCHGFHDGRERTPYQVARLMGRTPAWVAKAERDGMARLKATFTGEGPPPSPVRYKGVTNVKGRWVAHLRTGGKTRHLGTFATDAEAARAYDAAATEAWRSGGKVKAPTLNFPGGFNLANAG